MKQSQDVLIIRTHGEGNHNITEEVTEWVERQGIAEGLLTLFIQHISASLVVRETADRDDLHAFFRRLEGDDEFEVRNPPYIRNVHLALPVRDGRLALGARQGLYVFEHRETPHTRNIVLHLIGR